MPATVTVAQYLAHRLRSLGVDHLFGVPGDFSLNLLDAMLADGALQWVGSPNELNAGYAADAYARTKGIAALVTTFGVGELSALNAVAGSYAENVPVVQITGAPPTVLAARGALTHHTLADGDFDRFARAYAEITATGGVLTAENAADRIDTALATARQELRPVYLSIPVDVASAPIPAARLDVPLPTRGANPASIDEFRARATALLATAISATLIAGHLIERTKTQQEFTRLAHKAASPVVTLISARSAFDSGDPLFSGVYCGELGTKRAARAVDTADVLIEAGTLMSDVQAGVFTHRDDPAHTIHLGITTATIAGVVIDDMPLAAALEVLTELVDGKTLRRETPELPATAALDDTANPVLDQATMWAHLESWFPAGHRLVTDIGTTFFSAMNITLPAGSDVVAQPVWSSIGYALPATLGCALADPNRRPVLVIGDGAAQMTVQDLSTLAWHGASPIVIIVDNSGYTIERAIQSPQAVYNDIPTWDWCALARAFAPDKDILTATPTTPEELDQTLTAAAAQPDRMAVVHITLDPMDTPPALRALAEIQRAANPASEISPTR